MEVRFGMEGIDFSEAGCLDPSIKAVSENVRVGLTILRVGIWTDVTNRPQIIR